MTDIKQTLEEQPEQVGEAPVDGAPLSSGAPTVVPDAEQAVGAAELEGDLDELVKTARQRDEYLALAQRTQADFENYRKRAAREAAAARDRGVSSLAKELLPALDNLDRALEAAAENDPLLQGVRLVRTELKAALSRAGIESFCPLGEPFDPSVHEAVATASSRPAARERHGCGGLPGRLQAGRGRAAPRARGRGRLGRSM